MYDFSFDDRPEFQIFVDQECRLEHQRTLALVLCRGRPFASYLADWHTGGVEAVLRVTTGDFREPDYRNQVTIDLRVHRLGTFRGSSTRLIDALPSRQPVRGRELTAALAGTNPRLVPTLAVADWLARNDAVFNDQWGILHHWPPETAATRERTSVR